MQGNRQVSEETGGERPSVSVLGSRVDLVTLDEAVGEVESWIRAWDGRCRRVVVTGFHGIWEAYKDPELKRVLNSAELWVPDGIAPVLAARWRGHKNLARVPGMEILNAFLRRADREGFSSYFYGDTDATLSALREKIENAYPGHRVAGMYSPPFRALTAEEDDEIIERINEAKPDVLWVGLGMPKQDRWIYERLDRLKVPVAMGVGAAFGFVAGRVSRCPEWIGRLGFEWVWRFLQEPKKLWKRDLLEGPQFLFHLTMDLGGWREYK